MSELPQKFKQRILREVNDLCVVYGKQTLMFELNGDSSRNVSSIKIKKYSEEEERL